MSERLTVGVAARLSRYLQVLTQAKKMGRSSISSQDVSEYTHINATQIRRDLSAFGKFGKRGVGYNIDALIAEIRGILRTSGQHNIALVGAGRLGQAIAGSSIFADHGFHIVTIFDDDPAKIGTELGGVAIRSTADLAAQVAEHNIIAAVIAVPAGAAQTRRRSARQGRRAHHLQLLRGAPADAVRTSSCTARARRSSSCTRSTSTSRSACGVMRRARARARPPSRRSRAAAKATSGTAHRPVDQPNTQARRQEKEVRPPRSLHTSRIGRSGRGSRPVARTRW